MDHETPLDAPEPDIPANSSPQADGVEEPAPLQDELEAFAQAFAGSCWVAMRESELADPEGYEKLAALSKDLRHEVLGQMCSATDAPDAIAMLTFMVEFLTMFLAQFVSTHQRAPAGMVRGAGLESVTEEELLAMFGRGLVLMCEDLFRAGNAKAEAETKPDEDSKIVAFVP
jgi:hypothetical protein